MNIHSLKSAFCSSAYNLDHKSGFRFSLRPLTFGLAIGLGVGLATKNVGVGIALAVVFAVVNGAFGRRAE